MTGLRETRLIVVFCLAMVVLVWIDVAWLVAKARGDAIEKGYSEAFTAANVFAEQATRTIRLLDSISQLVGHDLAKSPSPSLLKELVDEHALTMDTLVMLSFIDASGRTEGSNLGPDPNRTDVSDREHIRVQLNHMVDGLYVGKPVLGRVSGKWSIQLSRRVEDAGGRTLGVLVVSIDPHYFERFWSQATAPAQIVDELVGLDGVLRATSLNVESALEKRTTRDAIAHDAATASSGRLEVVDDDGDARLVQFVRLDGLPLFVTASIKRSSALAASSLAVRSYIMFGLAITAVIVVFGVLLMNLAARLRKSGDQAQKAERRLIEAIETIPEGFVLFDSEDRLVTCNSAYREVYSTTADQIRPGVRFEELLRLGLERGQHRVPEERARRLARDSPRAAQGAVRTPGTGDQLGALVAV